MLVEAAGVGLHRSMLILNNLLSLIRIKLYKLWKRGFEVRVKYTGLRAENHAQQKFEEAVLGNAIHTPYDDKDIENHFRPGGELVYDLPYRSRDHRLPYVQLGLKLPVNLL
jgi:hypothetical protein